jgi:4-hydroxy-tetrahydrodipicolinate reductase
LHEAARLDLKGNDMRIVINGASGRMGRELVASAMSGYHGATLVAAVDVVCPSVNGPAYTALADVTEDCDVLIDFSHHSATKSVLDFALLRGIPVVIATTGQTDEESAMIEDAARHIPVFCAGNMSIGIALLVSLVKTAVKTFPDADVEIVETHHNQKLDVPSGTALMIAHGVEEAREGTTLCIGRHENGKRPAGEVGIHSIRMGRVVGIHEVHINTGSQTITLKHEAHSRALFAEGALHAADFMCGKAAGLYTLQHLFE